MNIIEKTEDKLTSDKWRQTRPRDLCALSCAVHLHLPQLKPEGGSSQVRPGDKRVPSQERRVRLQQPIPGEGRHFQWAGESSRAEGEGRLE